MFLFFGFEKENKRTKNRERVREREIEQKKMINFGNNMMHADQFRKMETYSPKSSPRGGRSPIVSRQDSSGTLKMNISLGKIPSIVHSGPFYLMKDPPGNY